MMNNSIVEVDVKPCHPAKQKTLSEVGDCFSDHPSMLKSVEVELAIWQGNSISLCLCVPLEVEMKVFFFFCLDGALREEFSTN